MYWSNEGFQKKKNKRNKSDDKQDVIVELNLKKYILVFHTMYKHVYNFRVTNKRDTLKVVKKYTIMTVCEWNYKSI